MSKKLFGTDGIRGTANSWPMTADVALKVGRAAGQYFMTDGKRRHKAVIAKDTRLSGYMLEPALTAGLTSAGMDVILVGPLPTPAVAMLTRSMRADMGIMLSASHNPFGDNGIKLFGPDGHKLSKDVEAAIEAALDSDDGLAAPETLGRAKRLEDARGRYIEFAKATFPKHLTLEGLTIVLDCANGAAYQVAPIVLRELGAKVIALSVEPDGFNINADCGSTYPKAMREAVLQHKAHAGIALDGDADRVVMCDEAGNVLNGDQLLAIIATAWQQSGRLNGGGIVATQMSNLGMERYIQSLGLSMERTKVGDRYVMEKMQASDYNVGGEQSGHIILSDYSTTGDGLVAALQVLSLTVERGENLSAMSRLYTPLPQILKNVRYAGTSPLKKTEVQTAIEEGEAMLEGKGRVLVRASGTEPLIRVMVEGEDEARIRQVADSISRTLEQAA